MRVLGRIVVLIVGVVLIQFAVGKSLWIGALSVFFGASLIEWWAVDKFKDRNGL